MAKQDKRHGISWSAPSDAVFQWVEEMIEKKGINKFYVGDSYLEVKTFDKEKLKEMSEEDKNKVISEYENSILDLIIAMRILEADSQEENLRTMLSELGFSDDEIDSLDSEDIEDITMEYDRGYSIMNCTYTPQTKTISISYGK